MIKKILCAVTVAVLLALGHAAHAQNLNQPAQLNNLNNPSNFQGGQWTPVIVGVTTPGTVAYSNQSGTYEIIGRQVTARFSLTTSAINTLGGAIQITGLPIAVTSSTGDYGICNIDVFGGFTLDSGYGSLAGVITPGTTTIGLVEMGSGKAFSMLGTLGGVGLGTSYGITATPATIIGSCMYRNP